MLLARRHTVQQNFNLIPTNILLYGEGENKHVLMQGGLIIFANDCHVIQILPLSPACMMVKLQIEVIYFPSGVCDLKWVNLYTS